MKKDLPYDLSPSFRENISGIKQNLKMEHKHLPGWDSGNGNYAGSNFLSICRNSVISSLFLLLGFLLFSSGLYSQASRTGNFAMDIRNRVAVTKSNGAAFQLVKLFDASTRTSAQDFTAAVGKGVTFDIDLQLTTAFLNNKYEALTLEIPGAPGQNPMMVELISSTVLASGFNVFTSGNPGVPVQNQGGLHYQGIVTGNQESLVAISVFNDRVMGLISTRNGTYNLGKVDGPGKKHILYLDADLKKSSTFSCGTVDDGLGYKIKELGNTNLLNACPVRIYIEVDKSVYDGFGGNLTNTSNFVIGLFNQSFVIYANENINMVMSELFIWTTPDPYSGTTTGQFLSQFQANTGEFNGDLGHLIALQNIGGLAAGFAGLCNADRDQSLCFSGLSGLGFNTVPTYSFNVFILSHEMGHLVGSRHTHACVWNGNNTAIDGCSGFTEGGCPLPGSPAGGGTIMSYCHNDAVGINFNLGFGPQPGNVIRNSVTNAACLSVGCCVLPVINAPTITQPTCATPTGTIVVNATGSGTLEYSVNNGSTWQASATFSGLTPGNYNIKVRIQSNPTCSTAYANNPVVINAAPIVPNAVATPSSQTICTGTAITTIVNSGNVAGTLYNWTRDNTVDVTGIAASGTGNISGTLTNSTAAPVTVTFTITPSYTNAGGTCTGTPVTATVTVNQANYFVCPGNMVETINDVICFKAVLTPNPVYCGTLTKLTWKLTGATVLSSPTTGINYLGLRNMNVGTTTVTYTATFTGGIVKTCSFTVLVIETIPPNILCPLDKQVNTDAGKCYKTGPVSLGTPTTSDNCGVVSVTNNAPAVYNIGVNYVTWTVTDKSGNTRTCVQRVTVYDKERPTITCPANVIANTGPVCNATPVTLAPPVFSDNCRVKTVTWAMTGVTWGSSANMGINFVPTMNYATGVSTIIYTVVDVSGNSRTCTFTVTVKDVTPPTLVCPVAQTLCKVANNTYTIPLMAQNDNCDIASTNFVITGATSRSGSGTNASGIFNLGVSTIKWTVKDVSGNTSTCTTTVTVLATTDPACTPPLSLTGPGAITKYTEPQVPGLSVTAWPNPTVNYFNLKVNSPDKEMVQIRMYDMAGKLVQARRGVPGETYIVGEGAGSGTYIIEVSQGTKKQMVKLVKRN